MGTGVSDRPRELKANGHRIWIQTAYLGYLTIGMIATAYGPLLVSFQAQLGLSHTAAGLFLTAQFLGSVAGMLAGGLVTDRLGKRSVLAAAGLLVLAGALGAALLARFSLLLAAFAIMGVGFGAVDGTGNALVSDLAASRRAAALNRLNVAFSAGALLAPFLVARLFSAGLDGPGARSGAYGVIAGLALLFLLRLATHGPLPDEPGLRPEGTLPFAAGLPKLLGDRVLWLMGGILLAYVALETSVGAWWPAYLQGHLGVDEATAGDVLTIFFVGVVGGRLVTSLVVERLGPVRTLVLEAAMAALLFPAALLARSAAGAASVALAGFSASGLWGTTLALAAERHPGRSGTLSGLLMAMASLGSSLFPLWIGFVGDRAGLRVGFLTLEALLIGLVVLARRVAGELHRGPVSGGHGESP